MQAERAQKRRAFRLFFSIFKIKADTDLRGSILKKLKIKIFKIKADTDLRGSILKKLKIKRNE